MLDEELKTEIAKTLPGNVPHIFISAASNLGIMELKDELWKAINEERQG